MPSYIPDIEAEKIQWLNNFKNWVQANGTTHGLTALEVSELTTKTSEADTAVAGNIAAQDAAKAATATKNNALGAAVALARDFAQRIQVNPNTTDEDRGNAGLTIRDKEPTAPTGDEIMAITPPLLHLDFSIRQQVTIHWGPNPQDERRNGKPQGVVGCEIQYHRGGLPAAESEWQLLDTDTNSPYVHSLHEDTPTTYAYRARYLGKKLKHGPHGDPAVCTVSV